MHTRKLEGPAHLAVQAAASGLIQNISLFYHQCLLRRSISIHPATVLLAPACCL